MVIHIPTYSSSNEISSIVVVLVPLHLTLGCIVKHRWYHVRLLYNFPNGVTLAQEIIASPISTITKIVTIEDHKLDDTFFNVAFGSQSLLGTTSDLTGSDTS
jgi:hypothetical protein